MNTLKRFHGRLDALSERTKIVGLLVIIIAVVGIFLGAVALVPSGSDGGSESYDAAYSLGVDMMADSSYDLSNGITTLDETLSACDSTANAASARGYDVDFSAWSDGCYDAIYGETTPDVAPTPQDYTPDDADNVPRSDEVSPQPFEWPPMNPSPSEAQLDGFKTPSGNIICWAFEITSQNDSGQLECSLLSEGRTWVLSQTEEVEGSVKVFDIVFNEVDRMAPVLEYGQRWSNYNSVLTCSSEYKGLTCRNSLTGHGFFLSREEQRVS